MSQIHNHEFFEGMHIFWITAEGHRLALAMAEEHGWTVVEDDQDYATGRIGITCHPDIDGEGYEWEFRDADNRAMIFKLTM